ncbi:hypothetical protein JCM16303_004804 [Sporobolomyces ruberrimus]
MPGPSFRRRGRISLTRAFLLLLGCALSLVFTQPRWQQWTVDPTLARAQSVLWVTAHPDDESFFFAPTILNLAAPLSTTQRSLLCLSIGDYEGAGNVRRGELHSSCAVLGIAEKRCCSIHDPSLPDDPLAEWDRETVFKVVEEYAIKWNADAIVTFDGYGVSGHSNHRALYTALAHARRSESLSIPVYAIRSSNTLAKYSSLVLLPFALIKHSLVAILGPSTTSSSLFVSSFESFRRARESFAAHESQSRWFRTLFVATSRYLWYVQVDEIL